MNDKFRDELDRLLGKHGSIIALLCILDADIAIRRELERVNDIPFSVRPSILVEGTRENLQNHLREVRQDIDGIIAIIIKNEHGEIP